MSYNTIAANAADQAFGDRLRSCIAQEGHEPDLIFNEVRWEVVTAGDIEAAYASALAAENPNPGGDEAVITDGMILSAVQAALSEL